MPTVTLMINGASPSRRRLGPGEAAALRAAQRPRPHRRQVRLRSRPVRRLHRADRRCAGALLRAFRLKGAGRRVTARRSRLARRAASGAGRLHQGAGAAMRLLHQRHDHDDGGAARAHARSRREEQSAARRQSLPLRLARARRARSDARGRKARGPGMGADIDAHAAARSPAAARFKGGRAHRRLRRAVADAWQPRQRRRDPHPATRRSRRFSPSMPTAPSRSIAARSIWAGLRIAMPQMAAEELGIGVDKIKLSKATPR